jgi:hypothetical protein
VRRQEKGPRFVAVTGAAALALVLSGCGILPTPTAAQPTTSPPPSLLRPSPQATAAVAPTASVAGASCAITPFVTIPPNDVVGWDQLTWQRAADGIWAHPYLATDYTAEGGFLASDPGVKILWWVLDGGDQPLLITISSDPAGSFSARYSFDAPGSNRRDRPSGFPTPPAGCYQIQGDLGGRAGTIVDQVLP